MAKTILTCTHQTASVDSRCDECGQIVVLRPREPFVDEVRRVTSPLGEARILYNKKVSREATYEEDGSDAAGHPYEIYEWTRRAVVADATTEEKLEQSSSAVPRKWGIERLTYTVSMSDSAADYFDPSPETRIRYRVVLGESFARDDLKDLEKGVEVMRRLKPSPPPERRRV